jgi:CHAT domain-containing protein/tetratricopeptide (TPR) repeat protein
MHSVYNHLVIRTLILLVFFSAGNLHGYPQKQILSVSEVLESASKSLAANAPDSALRILETLDQESLKGANPEWLGAYYHTVARTYQTKGITDSTARYYGLAEAVFIKGEISKAEIIGDLYFLKGWLFLRARDFDSAGVYFNKALKTAIDHQIDSLTSLAYRSLGNMSLARRDYPAALAFYDQSYGVEIQRQTYSETNVAALFQNKGIIFAALDNHDSAKYYFEKSLKLKEIIHTFNDPSLATSFMNYSRFLLINGELAEALSYITKAERIYLSSLAEDHPDLALLYLNKASVLILLNRFEEALTYLEVSYQIKKNQLNPADPTLIKLYNNLGVVYENLGNYKEAIRFHKASLVGNIDPEQKVRSLRWLASCYTNLENINKADEYYKLAIKEAEDGLGKNNGQTAATYHRYGSFLAANENLSQGISYLNKALHVYIDLFGSKNRDVSNVLTSIGLLYENMGDHQTALQYYQDALISFLSFFEEKDYYQNPDLDKIEPDLNIFNALYNKSFSFYNMYKMKSNDVVDLKASFETIELTVELYQNIATGLDSENSRLLLTSRVNEIYNLAVKVTAELYSLKGDHAYLNLAFIFSEKSKASVLLSLIRETEATKIGNIPEPLRVKEIETKSEIAHYRNLIFEEKQKSEPNSTRIGQWQTTLNNKRLVYDSIISMLKKDHPEYYNLKYNFDVVSIQEIQKRLHQDAVFIEYKLVDSVLYSFIIKKDDARLMMVSFEEGLVADVEHYISLMNSFPDVTNVHKNSLEFAALGKRLFDKLFPFTLFPQSELIIIPDDILGYLSFDALVTDYPLSGPCDFRKIQYLIQRHPISYGYSATLLFNDNNLQSRKKRLLAMAPVYPDLRANTGFGDTAILHLKKLLTPLKYTLLEVESISKNFRGRSMTGTEATESNFKARASGYDILHFAMHTLIDDENPFASKLVFSLEGDTIDDGFLNTYEIYNLNLTAELAVLSACQTGVGKLNKGEGIMSMARGFFYAGVPGIVMTLWAIEDISSAEIVASFYSYLKSGLKKDHALRNAKLDYLSNANQLQAHPYFWAAYVQIGNNDPLSAGKTNFLFYGIPLFILIISGVLFLRRHKKSRL